MLSELVHPTQHQVIDEHAIDSERTQQVLSSAIVGPQSKDGLVDYGCAIMDDVGRPVVNEVVVVPSMAVLVPFIIVSGLVGLIETAYSSYVSNDLSAMVG